jgi:hypothetical protein
MDEAHNGKIKRSPKRKHGGPNAKNGKRPRDPDDFDGTRPKGKKRIRAGANTLPCTRIHVEQNVQGGRLGQQAHRLCPNDAGLTPSLVGPGGAGDKGNCSFHNLARTLILRKNHALDGRVIRRLIPRLERHGRSLAGNTPVETFLA